MLKQLLKVTHIGETKQTSSGQKYLSVTFKPLILLESSGSEVFSNQKERQRILFGSKDNNKGDLLFSEIQKGSLKIGSIVEGTIQTFNTTPYQPEGYEKEITSTTIVVFSGENGLTIANRNLKQNFASVVDENGNVTNPEALERPTVIKEKAGA